MRAGNTPASFAMARDSPSQPQQASLRAAYASTSASSPMPTLPSPARFDPSTYTSSSGGGSPRAGNIMAQDERLQSTFTPNSHRRGEASLASPRRGVVSSYQPEQPYNTSSASVNRSGAQQRQDSGLFGSSVVAGDDHDGRREAWLTSSGASAPRHHPTRNNDVRGGGNGGGYDGTSVAHHRQEQLCNYSDDDASPMELSAVGYDGAGGGRGGPVRRRAAADAHHEQLWQPRSGVAAGLSHPNTTSSSNKRSGSLDNLGNDQLHHRCLMLASCLEHTTSERDALSEMINNLTTYRDALLQDVFELRGDKQDLTDHVQRLERDIAAVQEELHRSVERADGLSAAKHLVEAARDKHVAELEAMGQKNRQLESDREALSQTVTLQQTRVSDMESQVAQLAAKLEHAQLEAARAQQELLESKIIEGQMDKMVMQREEALEQERTQLEACMREKAQLQQALQDATSRENASHRTLDGLSRGNEELRNEIKRLSTRHDNDIAEMTTLRADLAALRAKESTWLTYRETLEVQRGSAQGSSEQLVLRCQELKEHAAALEHKLESLLESNSKLQTSEAELKTKLAYTQEKTSSLQQANDSERERVADRDSRLQAMEAQVERGTVDAAALRNANEAMAAANEQLTQQLATTAAALAQTERALAEHQQLLRAADASHNETVVRLQSDRAFADMQVAEMRACTQILHDLHSHLLQTTGIAATQQAAARGHVEGLNGELQQTKAALDAAVEGKQTLVNTLQHEREAHNSLQHRVEQLETMVEQLTDMLNATRQDRDLLVTEIRRSQSLWMTMSEEQALMRNQQHLRNNTTTVGGGEHQPPHAMWASPPSGGSNGHNAATSPINSMQIQQQMAAAAVGAPAPRP